VREDEISLEHNKLYEEMNDLKSRIKEVGNLFDPLEGEKLMNELKLVLRGNV